MSTTRPPASVLNPIPKAVLLLDQFFEWISDAKTRHRVLVDNPAKPYGF